MLVKISAGSPKMYLFLFTTSLKVALEYAIGLPG